MLKIGVFHGLSTLIYIVFNLNMIVINLDIALTIINLLANLVLFMAALKNFLEIPYDKLEEMNLKAKEDAQKLSAAAVGKEIRRLARKSKRASKQ